MKWAKALVIIALLIVPTFGATAASSNLPTFSTEVQAQQHCPGNTVVWANTSSGIYHLQGTRWYGRTKSGAFVCEKEANQAGMRPARNSQ